MLQLTKTGCDREYLNRMLQLARIQGITDCSRKCPRYILQFGDINNFSRKYQAYYFHMHKSKTPEIAPVSI